MLSRRRFLTLAAALTVAPATSVRAVPEGRRGSYSVDVGLLYDAFTFRLQGTFDEAVDRQAATYEVRAVGDGGRLANRMESQGVLRGVRWAPVASASWVRVAGRESRTEIRYDYDHGTVEYHSRAETFFLRRLRVVDDVLTLPDGVHVDDAMSAILNYAEGRWLPAADGRLRTHVVRRRRPAGEGVEDVQPPYRAEIVPVETEIAGESRAGLTVAEFDLGRFTPWAARGKAARITFGPDRRPVEITAALILGSSVSIRFQAAA